MKKLVLALLLAVVSFNMIDAAILKSRISFVLFRNWDKMTKSVSLIPIDASIEDNRFIKVEFLNDESESGTFQIKDSRGNIIYYETVTPDINTPYNINISELKEGQYKLIYLDKHMEVVGEFTLNQ